MAWHGLWAPFTALGNSNTPLPLLPGAGSDGFAHSPWHTRESLGGLVYYRQFWNLSQVLGAPGSLHSCPGTHVIVR